MSKLDELYKQKEAILKELNKLSNYQIKREDYKIHYWTNETYRKIKINVIYKDIILKLILMLKLLFKHFKNDLKIY